MSDDDLPYTTAVDLLRDVSRERGVVEANAVDDLPVGLTLTAEEREAFEARSRTRYDELRSMDDRALRVLVGLLRACDYAEVFRAIKEADACWVYVVILDRALDPLSAEGGDA